MMNFFKKPIFHILLLIAALIIGLSLRLIRLGAEPLMDTEASIALQALVVGERGEIVFGPHIAYVGLTGLDFYLFNASNFLARFWPAIFGGMIVFVPHLFRDQIGRWPASILVIIFAISPEMVGLSRIISSPIMAFVSLLLAAGFILKRKPIFGGVTLALGLMSGAGFWTGLFLFVLLGLISKGLFEQSTACHLKKRFGQKKFLVRFFIAFVFTVLLVGTGFFLSPEGLSGVFSGAVDFVRGFWVRETSPFFLKPLALIAYGFGALTFGLWGGIRGLLLRNKLDIFLLLWAILGFSYLLIYPGASSADVVWVTLPLWTLAARAVAFVWRWPESNRLILAVTVVVIVVVSAFMLLAMRSMINPTMTRETRLATFIALVGGLVLLFALTLLVTYGWSEDVALPGLLLGLSVVLAFSLLSVSVRTTGLSPEASYELWDSEAPVLSTKWLKTSIDRVMDWNKQRAEPIEAAVVDFDTPAMRWFMRDYGDVAFVPYLPPVSQPGIFLSDITIQPEISNAYRGQDLVWSQQALWEEMSPFQILNWLITREAPSKEEEIIFWVRTDLMPEEQLSQ